MRHLRRKNDPPLSLDFSEVEGRWEWSSRDRHY